MVKKRQPARAAFSFWKKEIEDCVPLRTGFTSRANEYGRPSIALRAGLRGQRVLADDLFLQGDRAGAAGWAFDAIAELANVDLQLADGAAQGVAVHAQFARGSALVAFVFLEHGQDEALLEFTHAFGIKNIASVHLQDERFQLIFHDAFLSLL